MQYKNCLIYSAESPSWKLETNVNKRDDRNLSCLVSCRAYRGHTEVLSLVMELYLFMPKLHGSNKSLEYIYIHINIKRLFPSECEPVLENSDTDILRHQRLITLSWTCCFIPSSIHITLSCWRFSFTINRQDYQILSHFFSSLLSLRYWEKKEKSNWSSLFNSLQQF